MSNWFRTRWAALNWFFRIVVVIVAVLNTVGLLAAILPGDGGSILSALSGFALIYIAADWQYWEKEARRRGAS